MANFRYRALNKKGEVVSGLMSASSSADALRRIEYLRLVPIDTAPEHEGARSSLFGLSFIQGARAEDVTTFTLDLALLLKSGVRLDEALELLASDIETGRLRSVIAKIRFSVLSGESLAGALSHHKALFSPMYLALVRIGEASGKLDRILEMLALERSRAEALRRKVADALRYPAFLLLASSCVLTFFLTFVMPQFGSVLHDFGAKLDPIAGFFLALSQGLAQHKALFGSLLMALLLSGFLALRRSDVRAKVVSAAARAPLARTAMAFHRCALFCRNLAVLLAAGLPLTSALRVLIDIMAATGDPVTTWRHIAEDVRHGGKLSAILATKTRFPAMAVRMLRIGEETGQLPALAARVADFYEAKLQRSLDRIVGAVAPLAIIVISTIVGGLIVSVMSALLSVSQLVG
jgi:general secretion pathway protein F